MLINYHKNFGRKLNKLKPNEQQKTIERINLFIIDSYNPILNNHPLKGKYLGYNSINISGDLRAIFKYISDSKCIFITIDSHSNLYR